VLFGHTYGPLPLWLLAIWLFSRGCYAPRKVIVGHAAILIMECNG